MVSVSHDGPIWTISIGDDENRFSPEWVIAYNQALDTVEASPAPAALITTGQGKFFSNGLDLDYLGGNPDKLHDYVGQVQALFARVLTLGIPCVAAVNGHAFGAGAMLALAHDYRVMREDRGFFCFPEIDIEIPFTPGMSALILSKLTPQTAHVSMTSGRRYGGGDAQRVGIVDASASLEQLVGVAQGLVEDLAAKNRGTLAAIKRGMYGSVVEALHATA